MIQLHSTAYTAVPAFRRRNSKTTLRTQDNGITRCIHVHGPCDTEVKHDIAFQTYESCCKIIYLEFLRILRFALSHIITVIRASSEEIGFITGYSQRLGITDGIQHHVQGIAADITKRTDTGRSILDKGGTERRRDSPSSAASGLDIINLAKHAGLHDLLNHLHVFVQSGLEAYRHQLTTFFLSPSDGNSLIQSHTHGLLQKHMYALLKCINRTLCMGSVVCTYTDSIQFQRLVIQHLLMASVALCLYIKFLKKSLSFPFHQIRTGYDLHICLLQIAGHMSLCNPTGSDDTYTHLLRGIYHIINDYFFKTI